MLTLQMKKFNKVLKSNPELEELLISLQLQDTNAEDESVSVEDDHLEYSDDVSGEETNCSDSDLWDMNGPIFHEAQDQCEELDIGDMKSGMRYKISKGSSPFSLFNITAKSHRIKKEKEEIATIINQRLTVPERSHDYNFTDKDLEKYRIRRKEKIRRTCPNWDDVAEERDNEPKKIGFKSLRSKYRNL